jgi:hypothetical protein
MTEVQPIKLKWDTSLLEEGERNIPTHSLDLQQRVVVVAAYIHRPGD